jgi:hypothetical protein
VSAEFNQDGFHIEQPQQPPRSGFPWGCLFGGCLAVVVLMMLGVGLTAFTAYRFYSTQLAKYTAEQPRELPEVEFSQQQMDEVEQRVEGFQRKLEDGERAERLVLTEDDINALLARDENLRGKVYVHIEDGQLRAELSMPADWLPGGKGRFFNGEVVFEIELENGELIAKIDKATVAGEPVPEMVMQELRKENLGDRIMEDPKIKNSLEQFESIQVDDDRLILVAKKMSKGEDSETSGDSSAEGGDSDEGGDTSKAPPANQQTPPTEGADEA